MKKERDTWMDELDALSIKKFGFPATEWPDGIIDLWTERMAMRTPEQVIDQVEIEQVLFDM